MDTSRCFLPPVYRYKGQIQVIFGPMFSGKTDELMRRLLHYQQAEYRCLIITYANDRYDDKAMEPPGKQIRPAICTTVLQIVKECAIAFDIIGIDEGQFFPDIVEFAEELANMKKTVIVAGLDGTFERKGFGNILNLVPLAEYVVKLKAPCSFCYQDAHWTRRISEETDVKVIGGREKYVATCRRCISRPMSEKLPDPSEEVFGRRRELPSIV